MVGKNKSWFDEYFFVVMLMLGALFMSGIYITYVGFFDKSVDDVSVYLEQIEQNDFELKVFTNYSQVKTYLKTYAHNETIDTSRSSWIEEATYYYFEDKDYGYLILNMSGKEYVFDKMRYEVWEGFKEAKSLGKYYHANIKDKYYFELDY